MSQLSSDHHHLRWNEAAIDRVRAGVPGKVEFFDETKYLAHSSIAENLIFASVEHADYSLSGLPENKEFMDFLESSGMITGLNAIGNHLMIGSTQRGDPLHPDDPGAGPLYLSPPVYQKFS